MEQNDVVGMIDEEIERLTQVRNILQSLLPDEVLTRELESATSAQPKAETPDAQLQQPVRHVSRRGISTGRRGPRRKVEPVAPRALGAAVPVGPVVVSRAAISVAPPVRDKVVVNPPPPDGTLEALVRSLRPQGLLA